MRAALRSLIPPPRLQLSRWLETHVQLPEEVSPLPGPLRLYPYQRDIADAIGDPLVERVTIVKPVRVGYTTLLTGAVASFVANDPAPILCLQPTEADCRDFVVSDVEPTFAATPAVAGALTVEGDAEEAARNTLMHRRFPGGWLKVVAAKAPRNLRRHNARVLLVDEADAMEITKEGNPILLAEKRTLAAADRKIVIGSTPLLDETSHVLRAYAQSDQRVYEVPCPSCAGWTEIQWGHLEWDKDGDRHLPDTAAFRCPHCQTLVAETHKPAMVAAGRWRATKPEVRGHAGFRLNALVSPLANARWGNLVAEFLRAKDDSDELQVFTNTILAQGWREAALEVDEAELASRAEPFSLDAIPPAVLVVTLGVDVQDDRLEASVVGWSATEVFVLGHVILWGSPDDDGTWRQLDDLLHVQWTHPHGGRLAVEACLVDSGDGDWTDHVYRFCFPRLGRKVFACKGLAGNRPVVVPSEHKAGGSRVGQYGRLMLVGVDVVKTTIYDRLQRGRALRFSDTLGLAYFEQVASERKVVRYVRGMPVRRFERKPGAKAEGLDCLVYAWAARAAATVDLERRAADLHRGPSAEPAPTRGPRFTNSFMGV
jgi:phage terminase large subunit GpA-like protein